MRVNNGGNADTLSVWNAANTTQVALTEPADLQLRANRTTAARVGRHNDHDRNQVAITLGGIATGSTRTATATTPMRWTPSTAATDLAGNPRLGAVVIEIRPSDRDF